MMNLNNSITENMTFITVHTKPSEAVNETSALHDVVETYLENRTQEHIILLGDFNADCSYASTYELNQLSLRQPQYSVGRTRYCRHCIFLKQPLCI